MNRRIYLVCSIIAAIGILGYQNCSGVNFSSMQPGSNNGQNNPLGGNPGGGGGTTPTIQQFQPALAVRDISCLACHANVQANIITDFGSPDPWYMGALANATDFGQIHYTATNWQTLDQINGQVIVPDTSTTTVPNSYVQSELKSGSTAPTGPISLLTYLTLTDVQDFGGAAGWYSYFGVPAPATTAFTSNVTGGTQQIPVVAQPTVYIGAPTVQEILAIAPSNPATGPWIQVVGANATGLAGLTIETGLNNAQYVESTGTIQCGGLDVVINGTLLLNNAQLEAGSGGCRFYVTGSVFIEGQINYLDTDPTNNIQITSATSIIMGVGLNGKALNGDGSTDNAGDSPLNVRLISDVRDNLFFRGVTTSAAYGTYANSIMAEGTNIGLPLLQDASVPGSLPTALSAAKQPRAEIDFQHILLNAPLIHSRYMGTVSGVIVAESAEFSLGEFSFNYDSVFQNVAVLPALPYDILCTGTPCTPANP